jgi:hypothetical protein
MSTPDDHQLTSGNEPPEEPRDELKPGAGRPLVEGAPMSVSDPAEPSTVNRFAALGAIGLLAAGIVVVLIVGVLLLGVCVARH